MKETGEVGFGEELRRQRLVREVPLESIAAATKISVRYLEALERGDFHRLPAPVFTRGFIRAYAGYLGLDPEEMVNAYLSETGAPASRPTPTPEGSTGHSNRRPSSTFLAVGALAAALLTLIVLGMWRSLHQPRRAALRTTVPQAPLVPPPHVQEIPPASDAAKPAEPPPPSAAPENPPPLGEAGTITLSLDFQDDCWLELFADERLIYSGIIRNGENRHFMAQRAFRMTLGNAAAARVTVNGRVFPPLGNPGEVVRDFRIDRSRLNSLTTPRG